MDAGIHVVPLSGGHRASVHTVVGEDPNSGPRVGVDFAAGGAAAHRHLLESHRDREVGVDGLVDSRLVGDLFGTGVVTLELDVHGSHHVHVRSVPRLGGLDTDLQVEVVELPHEVGSSDRRDDDADGDAQAELEHDNPF